MGSENMMGIQTLHPPWRETPAAAWLTSKKTGQETHGIPEFYSMTMWFLWGTSMSCSSCMFTLGCKEWQVHPTDRTWGTEPASSSIRKMPTIAPWHQQRKATTQYQLPMHRLQLPMSLAAAAKCKAVLGLAASNSTTSSPNLYVCISKSDSTDCINNMNSCQFIVMLT